ncbi:MAG: tripartite tricarboxylate transporter TctB family protein [Methyloligellaceae bacterium]
MQRLLDRDLLTALVLFFIGGVAFFAAGNDVKNWIFPLLAAYLLLGIAAALVARVVFAAIMKHAPDIVHLTPEGRIAFIDVLVFFLIVLGYMFVLYGLGFWLSSLLMLSLTSIFLTLEKTRRNVVLALVVPLATCVVAYFVFLHVFYVPFPKATWWPGLS